MGKLGLRETTLHGKTAAEPLGIARGRNAHSARRMVNLQMQKPGNYHQVKRLQVRVGHEVETSDPLHYE